METTTKKSNVPLMIIGVFLSFFAFIGYMVYQSFQTDVNLVRDDYYQESKLHDQHVADINRTENTEIELYFDKNSQLVVLNTPFETVEGNIHFYRPSDAKLDFKVPITLNSNTQQLSTEAIAVGKWEVKAEFTYNGEKYYKESFFVK